MATNGTDQADASDLATTPPFADDRGGLGVEITDLNKATADTLERDDF
ncbi:MAG: hypothetical protein GY717_12955 [Rhodobacteraceae bacterium]|nr:hypothetical protein [Paracoccaceae bacterium]